MTRAEIEAASRVTKGEPTFPAQCRLAQLQIGLLLDVRERLDAILEAERDRVASTWVRAVPEPRSPRKASK